MAHELAKPVDVGRDALDAVFVLQPGRLERQELQREVLGEYDEVGPVVTSHVDEILHLLAELFLVGDLAHLILDGRDAHPFLRRKPLFRTLALGRIGHARIAPQHVRGKPS